MKISVIVRLLVCGWKVHSPICLKFKITDIKKIIEAVAWVIKYFVDASMDRGFDLFIIRGIMASRFISKPIHIRKKLELSIVTIGPEKMVK